MRSKRDLKIPKILEGFVHNINTNSTTSKKNVSKKKDSVMNQSLNKNGKGDKGNNNGNTKKGEFSNVTEARYVEQQELEGFMGGLNGEQFPSIKDMAGMPSGPSLEKDTDSDGIKEGMSTRDEDDCVTKIAKTKENQGSSSKASNSGKENPWNLCKTGDVKSLVDIVNASKLDNKLVEIPTIVNENGNEVVIFDDELIDLGSKK
ncbi:hypothetical protein Tco_1268403 [Tanacetum coccineum]